MKSNHSEKLNSLSADQLIDSLHQCNEDELNLLFERCTEDKASNNLIWLEKYKLHFPHEYQQLEQRRRFQQRRRRIPTQTPDYRREFIQAYLEAYAQIPGNLRQQLFAIRDDKPPADLDNVRQIHTFLSSQINDTTTIDWLIKNKKFKQLNAYYNSVFNDFKTTHAITNKSLNQTLVGLEPHTLTSLAIAMHQTELLKSWISSGLIDVRYVLHHIVASENTELLAFALTQDVDANAVIDDALDTENKAIILMTLNACDASGNRQVQFNDKILFAMLHIHYIGKVDPDIENLAIALLKENPNAPIDFAASYTTIDTGVTLDLLWVARTYRNVFMAILDHPQFIKSDLDPHELFNCYYLYKKDDPDTAEKILNVIKSIARTATSNSTDEITRVDTQSIDCIKYWFEDFPRQDIWRFFIDGVLQRKETGWVDFEKREPGYLKACSKAFVYTLENSRSLLSVDILKSIHEQISTDVDNLNTKTKPGEFRDNSVIHFNLNLASGDNDEYNLSPSGLVELLENPEHPAYYLNQKNDHLEIFSYAKSAEEIEVDVVNAIDAYHEANSQEKDAKALLRNIATLIREVERIHPFGDANCRTICMVLLNRELIYHGFMPAILQDPNRFDGLTVDECVTEIIQGMNNFQDIKQGHHTILGQATAKIINELETRQQNNMLACYESSLEIFTNAGIGYTPSRPSHTF